MTLTGNVLDGRTEIQSAQEYINFFYDTHLHEEEKITCQFVRSPPLSDEEILEKCRSAKNAGKFYDLYDKGDISNHGDDNSVADLALISLMAFYTQCPEQLDRLFRQSKLMRDKWEREDYRNRTIQNALALIKETYQGPHEQKEDKSSDKESPEATWENPAPINEGDNLEIAFPIKELPEVLRTAVEEVARCYQVDPALAALPGLGISALMMGKKVIVIEKLGLRHQASLLLLGVAASGERKTSVFDAMLEGIKVEIDKEMMQYEKEKASVRAHNELIKEQVLGIKGDLKKQTISKQEAQKTIEELYASEKQLPPEPYNFGDDITEPRLFQKLYDHKGSYGVFSSDGRSIIKKILGSKNGESGESIYLGGMWGDDLSRSRVGNNKGDIGGEDILIRKPALTTVAFIGPESMGRFI